MSLYLFGLMLSWSVALQWNGMAHNMLLHWHVIDIYSQYAKPKVVLKAIQSKKYCAGQLVLSVLCGIVTNFWNICVQAQCEARWEGVWGCISFLNCKHHQLTAPNGICCLLDYTKPVSGTLVTACVPMYCILKLQLHGPTTWTYYSATDSVYSRGA